MKASAIAGMVDQALLVRRRGAEPAGEPGAGAAEQVDLVLAFGERMALAGIDDEFVLDPVAGQRAGEGDRLAHRHVGIVLAVHDQHRGADLRSVGDRAELVMAVRARALPAAAAAEARLPGAPFAHAHPGPAPRPPGRGLGPGGPPPPPGRP